MKTQRLSKPNLSDGSTHKDLLDPIEWPPTAQFLRLLWAMPATHAARQLGCSQASVLMRAHALGLPRPGHGYWQRRIAGMALVIPDEVQSLMVKLDAEAGMAKPASSAP